MRHFTKFAHAMIALVAFTFISIASQSALASDQAQGATQSARCDLLAQTLLNRTGHASLLSPSCQPLAKIFKLEPQAQKSGNKGQKANTTIIDGIDFGDDSSNWNNDGECDDPRFRGQSMAVELVDADIMHDATDCATLYREGLIELAPEPQDVVDEIDFGDNASQWASDGECDDPRFDGPGSADTVLDEDLGHDAVDCRKLFLAGEIIYLGDDPNMEIIAVDGIVFGDNISQWASDGECDDPRFAGQGMATTLVDDDREHDAADCLALYQSGAIRLIDTQTTTDIADIDFGDDASEWANDGECDDPRFEGEGVAAILLEEDLMHDATDCRTLFDAGMVYLSASAGAASQTLNIDFGDDSSTWANDGECDDPRFEGEGVAATLLEDDLMRDATDCRTLYQAGAISLIGSGGNQNNMVVNGIDFGDDTSTWANDGECDDPRFQGEGTATTLLEADLGHDATDCRTQFEAGNIIFIGSQSGQSTDVSAIDFGDDTSTWANDGECDDPRFQGEGTAATLLEADLGHDATDCRTQFEAGNITYIGANSVQGTATMADGINFGDDSSSWANNDICDDPRFEGEGAADIMFDEDEMHDATDCSALYAQGKVQYLADGGSSAADTMVTSGGALVIDGIDFGDDASSWATNGECDDPRFQGAGSADILIDDDLMHDATDCASLYQSGAITLAEGAQNGSEMMDAHPSGIDFGDDSSIWANDGECDDTRFAGEGMADKPEEIHTMHDATDCRTAFDAGTISAIAG